MMSMIIPQKNIKKVILGGNSWTWYNSSYSKLKVFLAGAGGGGAGSSDSSYSGGGGGSGAIIYLEIELKPGDQIQISAGAGGSAGANGGSTVLTLTDSIGDYWQFIAGGGAGGTEGSSSGNGSPGSGGTASYIANGTVNTINRIMYWIALVNGNSGSGTTGGSPVSDSSMTSLLDPDIQNNEIFFATYNTILSLPLQSGAGGNGNSGSGTTGGSGFAYVVIEP